MLRKGVRLLGVPLGSEEYVGEFLTSALVEERRGLDQLQHLGDPQVAIRILTQVFAQRLLTFFGHALRRRHFWRC